MALTAISPRKPTLMKNHRRLRNSPVLTLAIFAVLGLFCVPLIAAAASNPVIAGKAGSSVLSGGLALAGIGSILPMGSKSAEIAELQKANADLTTAKTALEGEKTQLEAQIGTLTQERDSARTDLAAEKARADKAVADLATATTSHAAALKAAEDKHAADLAQAKKDHEARIDADVTARLAAAGGDPLPKDPKAKAQGDPASPPAPVAMEGKTAVQLISMGMAAHFEKRGVKIGS